MLHGWNTRARDAAAVLEHLKGEVAQARARLDAMLDFIRTHRRDPRRAHDVGLLLDEIARKRLQRLHGHTTFEALVRTELGISRVTAHRWRAAAREAARAPRERAARETKRVSKRYQKAYQKVVREARALASRLRRRGARDVRVEVFEKDGEPMLRIELPAKHGRDLA